MDGYIVAGPRPIFRTQLNDGRTVRFPAIFALHADFVRRVRVDAHDSQPRRTHESAVVGPSSLTPTPFPALNLSLCQPSSISRLDEPAIACGDAPDFVEVGEAGIAVEDAM